jgi:D-glycero-alpha-D-manno-heptose-7-phosphate kinase
VETVLGILGGKQDQYAAAHGGFHLYEFQENQVNVHPVQITPPRIAELESLCTLCYTGQARLSSTLHENVWGGFRAGKRQVVDALFALRDSAYRAKVLLEEGNWDSFGELLNLQHQCAKNLDDSLSNARVESIFELVQPFINGGKCCGAGGGGCMLFLSPSPEMQQQCTAILEQHQIQVIPFQFALDGLSVERILYEEPRA